MTKQFGKPFQPGRSGNPRGRPKDSPAQRIGKLMDSVLKQRLQENDGHLAEVLTTRLIQLARKGSLKALELILERTEGRAQQTMNLNTNDAPTVKDIDQRISELVRRAASREDDGRGENATPRTAGDSGKDTRLQ